MMQEVVQLTDDISVVRRLTFAASNLSKDIPGYWELVRKFGYSKTSSLPPALDKVKLGLENLSFLDEEAFSTDNDLLQELFQIDGFQGHPLGIVLISENNTCNLCGGELRIRKDRPSFPIIYTEDLGTVEGTHFRKHCSRGCSFIQHYGFCFSREETIYDKNCLDLPYFLSSNMTAFESRILKNLSAELLIGQVSYRQRSEIYNYTHQYDHISKGGGRVNATSDEDRTRSERYCDERQALDRRRLEEAHLKFCVLDVFQRYNEMFPVWKISSNWLDDVTPLYYEAFEKRYAEHTCKYSGCRNVLVIDGNAKNRRDICAATEAGYIQYEGLPGAVKTGCLLSPAFQCKYCINHAPRIVRHTGLNEDDRSEEVIAKLITAKKETRNGKYYQVAWLGCEEKLTWEHSSSLPDSLIEEFEKGTETSQSVLTSSTFGVTNHTLIISEPGDPPPAKKTKKDYALGIFEDPLASGLTCNTQKDKSRIHHRTAGILAAVRPCGIIVLISELFTSESKSQVYANLHEYLRKHPTVSQSLEFICYDDGCHLRKYARNPSRFDCTPTAKRLAEIEIVIDKMHMRGHVDKWCVANCDPHHFQQLNKVDTEVCEQCFSWLSRFKKMTRKISRSTFLFFLIYMCDLHNEREVRKLKNSQYL